MTRASPTVTVIIPTFNRARLLAQAIDSVLNQTRKPDCVVVVDDGSRDGTTRVLADYGDRIQCRRQANAGKPFALNAAIAEADCDYLWIFDDDDVALPDALERHLACLENRRDAQFTYSGCYLFESDEPPGRPDPDRLYDALEAPPDSLFIRWLETFPGHTGGMLVPLDCYRAVGDFDTALTFGEDYEMMLRLARRFRGAKLSAPTFLMRRHSGARGPAHERHAVSEREKAWRVYERRTFLDLRRELDLSEYVPSGVRAGAATERRALLQRACVMARHGLFEEAFEDMKMAVATPASVPPMSEERLICSRMLDLEPVLLQGQGVWLNRVRHLLLSRAPRLFDACIAGLGWSVAREWSRGSYMGTVCLLWAVWRLAGFGIAPRLVKRAWNQPLEGKRARRIWKK